ncbi:MAG: ABC transporter substrate-binding protein [Ktedonobacterales bacterium]
MSLLHTAFRQLSARSAGLSLLSALIVAVPLLLTACGPATQTNTTCGSPSTGSSSASSSSHAVVGASGALAALTGLSATTHNAAKASTTASAPTPVTLGLTYVPNIQFAPFYVAAAKGFYQTAGLNVTLRHHGVGEDEFASISTGHEDAIFAGGDETMQARSKGLPLVYVANVFTKYPVTLIVPASSCIHSVADLKGHTIGVPGLYGATYIGLLALLQSAGLSPSSVHIQSVGYTQVSALLTHKVDAVMGYINNEALQFQAAKFAIRTFTIPNPQPLVSNGLAVTQSELAQHPDVVRALIAATMQGVAYTIAHPQDAFNISKQYVPGLGDSTQAATQMAVLQATQALWQINVTQPGYNNPSTWQAMASFLQKSGQLSGSVDATQVYSNAYLPAK